MQLMETVIHVQVSDDVKSFDIPLFAKYLGLFTICLWFEAMCYILLSCFWNTNFENIFGLNIWTPLVNSEPQREIIKLYYHCDYDIFNNFKFFVVVAIFVVPFKLPFRILKIRLLAKIAWFTENGVRDFLPVGIINIFVGYIYERKLG